jgi:PIN domain nuclease of toxin-antitoxin system
MTTIIRQTWDLGDGELTIEIIHARPLPDAAFSVLAALASNLHVHAAALRALTQPGEPGIISGGSDS